MRLAVALLLGMMPNAAQSSSAAKDPFALLDQKWNGPLVSKRTARAVLVALIAERAPSQLFQTSSIEVKDKGEYWKAIAIDSRNFDRLRVRVRRVVLVIAKADGTIVTFKLQGA